MEFYQELLPLETELADLRPGERVDLRAILKRQIDPPVCVFQIRRLSKMGILKDQNNVRNP